MTKTNTGVLYKCQKENVKSKEITYNHTTYMGSHFLLDIETDGKPKAYCFF